VTAIEAEQDLVVLLQDDGTPAGTAPRLQVHGTDTPLHQAFSLHLFDDQGRVLITRRALSKLTWPGVWTNSCCGHPRPGEPLEDAVRRRLREELDVDDLQVVLPDFRYRAVDASGVVENEICPVLVGRVRGTVAPDPGEVAEHQWVEWSNFVAAAGATPGVYSPWSVLQVPRLDAERPRLPIAPPASTSAVADAGDAATVDAVVELLGAELSWVGAVWDNLAPAGGPGPLAEEPGDLPGWLRSLLLGGGKRLRPRMCHWGFVASGGQVGSPRHADVVRAAAALETLHLFALVHDDVMDASVERRGAPAAHVVAARRHRETGGHGDADRFGENLALLLGDLAHTEADRLVHTLPSIMRDYWYELSLELIVGQRADLTGAASRRTDLAHAEAVAALKSGAYTIGRPLHLGALAAGADLQQRDALDRYGVHLGRAFAWRDDVLGVWGDPAVTGKPAGDDLREGKTTLIWVLGSERLTGEAADALVRVGSEGARDGDVALLQDALEAAGVRAEVEDRIRVETERAEAALQGSPLTPEGVAGLCDLAHAVSWRNA
jgi:isopentenyl-diphosphate delta-isomerase type 1